MLKALRILGLLMLAMAFFSSQQASADEGKDESGHGKGKYEYKEEKHEGRGGEYKHEWQDGNCKYEYKSDGHGYKEERKCKGGARYASGPPPWAPAHGYRSHQGGGYQGVAQAAYVPPFDLGLGRCNRQTLGTLLGAAGGGYLGSRIGKGDGRLAAVGGGVFLGAIIGGSIGRSMDEVDQNCVGQALEHAPDGEVIAWNTPETASSYQITPVSTYEDSGGRYCRKYQSVSIIGDRQEQTYGTACRQPDGSWQRAN